jgi:hypothetical protein
MPKSTEKEVVNGIVVSVKLNFKLISAENFGSEIFRSHELYPRLSVFV